MPFGLRTDPLTQEKIDFDDVYKFIIKPSAEDLSLSVTRADEIQKPGWIHRDMVRHIYDSDVAIVDITLLNPNVFYELGIRHALRKSITVIMQKEGTDHKGVDLPFNIGGMRVIKYGLTLRESAKAKSDLQKFIRTGLENPDTDSLVYEVFPDLYLSRK
jgi:hypothetical protein